MTQEDAKTIADTIGAVIARERKAMRAELEAAIAAAKASMLAEARAMIAEARSAELQRHVDRLLGSPSQPQRLKGAAAAVLSLPSRRIA